MPRKSSYNGQDRTVSNAAQTLLANIRFANVDNPIKTMVVTSSVPNEGKSTISVELARSIARAGRTVLLVECDMRRRSLAAELNLHPTHGLYSLLSGNTNLASTAVSVEKNFYFIDVEPHIPNPPEIIASNRFKNFVEEMRGRFSYVVFDTPPLAAFVDAAVLSTIVDGTVMVVRENFARRSEVTDAFKQLESAGGNVLGVCMNFCHEERSDYYYAYYDEQGNRIRSKGKSGGGLPRLFGGMSGSHEHSQLAHSSEFEREPSTPAPSQERETPMPVNRTRSASSAAPASGSGSGAPAGTSRTPASAPRPRTASGDAVRPSASSVPSTTAPASGESPRAATSQPAEPAQPLTPVRSRDVISRHFRDLDEE